jgi:hypothetical protein
MQPSEGQSALAAATSTAPALGLAVDDAIVLHDSNELTVRLLPCDVVARVAPIAHQVARFEIGLAQMSREVSPSDYANALERLHSGMRKPDLRTPHFTDRVEAAQHLVETTHLTPDLAGADRKLLITALRSRRQAIADRGAAPRRCERALCRR